ncbi:t-SNARE [Obelidium mucronatum]|nr:t-SNARE [Obelidium mucronatum]
MSFGDFVPPPPTANQAAQGLATAPFSDGDTTAAALLQGPRPIKLERTLKGNTPPPGSSLAARSASPDKILHGRQLWDKVSNCVFQISNNVASLDALVKQLGSSRDTTELRGRLHELTESTRDMIKQTGADLKSLVIPENASNFEGRQHKMAQQKLQKDFENVLARFQDVSKMAARKSQEYVQKARTFQKQHQQQLTSHDNDDDDASENAPLLQQQAQESATLDMEVEYNESLIQEREQDLQNIERSIIEVNEIFRDLGTIVGEQQFMLDHIESNVGSVAVHVEGATNELRVAADRQKAAQNRMCCLYTVLGAIGLVVIMVLLR